MKLPENVERFRLGMITAGDPDNGVSLMRAWGPLSAMAREDRRLELVGPALGADGRAQSGWSWLAGLDGLFMSAVYTPHHGNMARMAKMMGIPVWVDWDDDLCSVPIYNPRAASFDPEKIGPMLETLVNLADAVTVSTEEIKRRRDGGALGGQDKIRILPNGCQWPFVEGPRTRRIVWRGWGNHDADLLDVLPAIADVARRPENSLWKWAFLGEPPWQAQEAIPSANLEHDVGADPMLYMGMLCHLRPWLQIVPLRDNGFNRCRSNLAWIEATCAGALTLAPCWEEWNRPGVRGYEGGEPDGPAGFGKQLRLAIEDFRVGQALSFPKGGGPMKEGAREIHSDVADSRKWIAENIALKKLNEVRWEILNEMSGRRSSTALPGPRA